MIDEKEQDFHEYLVDRAELQAEVRRQHPAADVMANRGRAHGVGSIGVFARMLTHGIEPFMGRHK